eukprot:7915165-Karenia_brevis.AAC.1
MTRPSSADTPRIPFKAAPPLPPISLRGQTEHHRMRRRFQVVYAASGEPVMHSKFIRDNPPAPLEMWVDFTHTVGQVENSISISADLTAKILFDKPGGVAQTDHALTLYAHDTNSTLRILARNRCAEDRLQI